jgi:inosine triphosphate pyrophosphatase
MNKLYFITGNLGKFKQAKDILPEIEQIDLDLAEIQELDTKKIIEEKLKEASKNNKNRFVCEDTALSINCLNGFPGPLIKWFSQSLTNKGIYELVSRYNNQSAIVKTILGLSDNGKIIFFEEELKGEMVEPKGEGGFGWDEIFKPEKYNKTLAQMTFKEKQEISPRTRVFLKLKAYLE